VTDGDPRAAVLAHIDSERTIWRELVAEVGEDRMDEPGPMGDWTFKDLASHLHHEHEASIRAWVADRD
jgi:hypothetical protein